MKQYFTLEVPKDSAFPFIVRHYALKETSMNSQYLYMNTQENISSVGNI